MKTVNTGVVNGKNEKAAKTQMAYAKRDTATDLIGDALAGQFGVDVHLAEVTSGKAKKKYVFVTVDGVQLQIQVVAKTEIVDVTDENLLATYSAEVAE